MNDYEIELVQEGPSFLKGWRVRMVSLLVIGWVWQLGLPHCAAAAPGDVDLSFDPGSGVDAPVVAIAAQPDGKILIGGRFGTVRGGVRAGVARLNPDGMVDSSFNPALGGYVGYWYDFVRAVAIQSDGKVLVGGYFTSVNGTNRNGIARLNSDGSLDVGFGTSANGSVESIALQTDGRILIRGTFTTVNNIGRTNLARLNSNGSLDAGFGGFGVAFGSVNSTCL